MKCVWSMMVTGLLVGLAGCMAHQETSKVEAQRRWADTRGRVLSSVAEDQFNTGDFESARRSASDSLKLAPDLLEARLLMARVAIEQAKYGEADEHLKLAAEKHPDESRIPYLQAIVEERRERYPEALKLYEKAQELDPKNPAYVLATAEVLVRLDRAADALALIESKLTTMDPTAGLYSAAGRLATLVEKHDRAVQYYSRATALWPDNLDIRTQLAKAYYFSGQFTQAISELESLTARAKDDAPVWMQTMLAQSYLADRQAPKAKAVFTELTRREPRVANHWVGLAKSALDTGDTARAMLSAREALALDPAQADAAIVLGYVLLKDGQNQRANTMLVNVTRKHPDNATLLCLLGRSYDALGQHEQAVKCFKAASSQQPGDLFAKMLAAGPPTPK